jgi:hypothetical protein
MGIRSVSGDGEPGRRLVIERAPVVVDGVTDYVVEDDGLMRLWSGAKPAGDFRPGTYQAVYYEPAEKPVRSPQPDPLAQAG